MHNRYVEYISTFTFTLLRPQRHKYWTNDNQYIRIIKMFALSQTGFSIIRSRTSLHTHTRRNLSATTSESTYDPRVRNDNKWMRRVIREFSDRYIGCIEREYLLWISIQSLSIQTSNTCCLCRHPTCARRTRILAFDAQRWFTCDVSVILDFVAMWASKIYTVKFVWVSPINSASTNPTTTISMDFCATCFFWQNENIFRWFCQWKNVHLFLYHIEITTHVQMGFCTTILLI